jgi:hypothetical protein
MDDALLAREQHYAELNAQPAFRLRNPRTWRAAWWAWWAVRRIRRRLRAEGINARVPAPPRLRWGTRAGVNVVLARLSPTCLERSLVLQRWLLAHGAAFDVVVGVRRDEEGVVFAHAWIDELDRPAEYAAYTVIHRLKPQS